MRQRELTPEVLSEQVKQRAEEYEKQLESTPQDVAGLKGAAESYVVLEEYASAAPLLQRIVDIEPSIENVGNLADVWTAAGKPLKAAGGVQERHRGGMVAGEEASPAAAQRIRGMRSIRTDGTALSLSYIKDFRQKSMAGRRGPAGLAGGRGCTAGGKGHGKEAEEKYRAVVDGHPD